MTEAAVPADASASAEQPSTFEDMGLHQEVLNALLEMGFSQPMDVQRAVFGPMMAGRDLLVQSRTGSGKTAAFAIPFAQGLIKPEDKKVQALCLAPTRELALQVGLEVERIGKYRGIDVVPIYGGAPMQKQIQQLEAGANVVAGTPGRVLDHLRRGTLNLDGVRVLVLDEADEMLSMGFLEDITEIIKRCPKDRQTVLFSATIPADVERIATRYMRSPENVKLSGDLVAAQEVKHYYYMVGGMARARDLHRIIEAEQPESAVIFCNTREETSFVAEFLRKQGLDAEAISSDLGQKDRERVMGRMKAQTLRFLVATDIAARGIDISNLSHVINYTFPESAEVYVHRTGRTGRAGKSGIALSLIAPRELGNFYMLKLTYKIKPEERPLPSVEEAESRREGAKLDELRTLLGKAQPAPVSLALARRLWTAEDGERVIATLIEERLKRGHAAAQAPALAPVQAASVPSAVPVAIAPQATVPVEIPTDVDAKVSSVASTTASSSNGVAAAPASGDAPKRERHRRERGGRERGSERGGRDRERGGRGGRGGDRKSASSESNASNNTSRGSAVPTGTIDTGDGREFWEAWVDSKTEPGVPSFEEAPTEIHATSPATPANDSEEGRGGRRRRESKRPEIAPGQARLYLNLGRRDGASQEDVERLLTDRGLSAASVELYGTHTYLNVTDSVADATCTALTGGKYGERELRCEPARR